MSQRDGMSEPVQHGVGGLLLWLCRSTQPRLQLITRPNDCPLRPPFYSAERCRPKVCSTVRMQIDQRDGQLIDVTGIDRMRFRNLTKKQKISNDPHPRFSVAKAALVAHSVGSRGVWLAKGWFYLVITLFTPKWWTI